MREQMVNNVPGVGGEKREREERRIKNMKQNPIILDSKNPSIAGLA